MARKAATKALVAPTLDEDAAERKRVLNVLAQRRYSILSFSLVEYALTIWRREKEEGAPSSARISSKRPCKNTIFVDDSLTRSQGCFCHAHVDFGTSGSVVKPTVLLILTRSL